MTASPVFMDRIIGKLQGIFSGSITAYSVSSVNQSKAEVEDAELQAGGWLTESP